MRVALGIAIVAMLVAPAHAATPSQMLNQGRELFVHKDYQGAEPILNDLLYPYEQLAQHDELVETYAMLGACLVELGRIDRAREVFERALKLEPDRALTPPYYSTETIHVFDETRAKLAADAKAVADAKKLQEIAAKVEAYKNSVQIFEVHSYSRNFVPFGAGQFQNKTPIRGIALAAGEAVTLATSMGSWFYLANRFGFNKTLDKKTQASTIQLAQHVQQLEIGTGIAFFALYGIGIVDSLLHYKPRVKGEFDESLLPPDLREPAKATKPAKTSLRDRIHVTPLFAPDALGIGIGWEN